MNLLTKTVGNFGEILTAFVLQKKYERQKLKVVSTGLDNEFFDLMVPYPGKGTPFRRPTLISVKARGKWSDVIPPNWPHLGKFIKESNRMRCDFWISFVHYRYERDSSDAQGSLAFSVHLAPASVFARRDFKSVKRTKGWELQLRTQKLRERAVVKFASKARPEE